MNFEEVFLEVIEILNRTKIPYFLTGALAVDYYGEPRTTHDIDLVIEISEKGTNVMIKNFRNDFFISGESIKVAIQEKSMFNAVHKETGLKVDFWMLGDDTFSKEMFTKRIKTRVLGTVMSLPTAEDVVIAKLEWFKTSDIDKHYFDALGIYRIQGENLDIEYITRWCSKKSIIKIWEKIKEEI